MASDAHRWGRRRAESILTAGSVYVGSESVYYAASGVAEAGSAILFLHEAGGSGATWHGQLVGLAQKARCLLPDLPGHGQSVGLGFQSVVEYRNAMIGFLDALAIRWPVVIAGVCLGAAIAIDLALHAPERVAGLVLTGLQEGEPIDPELFQRTARGEAPDEFVERMFSHSASERLKGEQLRRWRGTSPTVRHGDLLAMARYPLQETMRQVKHKVLMLTGAPAPWMPPEAIAVPSAGSLAMLEQPERFNRLVGDFLEEVRPAVPMVPAMPYGSGYRRYQAR